MNSFIYEPALLEKLFIIAQQKTELPAAAINDAAIEMIRNLRSDFSALKADNNPTFQDIKSLENFKQWAKNSQATFNGTQLVDNGDNFTLSILEKFLVDLRDRFANTPEFSEIIADLIDESNTKNQTRIATYTQNKPTSNQDNATAKKDKQGKPSLSVAVPEETAQNALKQPTSQGLSGLARNKGLSLLDGLEVDFDDVYLESSRILGVIESAIDKRFYSKLANFVNGIKSIVISFHNLTDSKTRNVSGVGLAPTDQAEAVMRQMESAFNGSIIQNQPGQPPNSANVYSLGELSKIASLFASLCGQLVNFYYYMQAIPVFAQDPDSLSVMKNQLQWATDYNHNFTQAANQYISQNKNTPGYGGP